MTPEINVLVVDNKEYLDHITTILNKEFHIKEIIHCDNSKDAMAVIDSDKHLGFIFADWELSGSKFIDAVRADRENHHTPLVIMAENDSDAVIGNAMRHGASTHIGKPFLEQALVTRIHRITSMQERRLMRRLHPDVAYDLNIDTGSGESATVKLVDISLHCCLTRAAIELTRELQIFETYRARMDIEGYHFEFNCQLHRIESDPNSPPPVSTVLFQFVFTELTDETSQKLAQLMDEFDSRWQ